MDFDLMKRLDEMDMDWLEMYMDFDDEDLVVDEDDEDYDE